MRAIPYIFTSILLLHGVYSVATGNMQLHDPGGSYSTFNGISAYFAGTAEILAAWLIYDILKLISKSGLDPENYRYLVTKKRKIIAITILFLLIAASVSDIFMQL